MEYPRNAENNIRAKKCFCCGERKPGTKKVFLPGVTIINCSCCENVKNALTCQLWSNPLFGLHKGDNVNALSPCSVCYDSVYQQVKSHCDEDKGEKCDGDSCTKLFGHHNNQCFFCATFCDNYKGGGRDPDSYQYCGSCLIEEFPNCCEECPTYGEGEDYRFKDKELGITDDDANMYSKTSHYICDEQRRLGKCPGCNAVHTKTCKTCTDIFELENSFNSNEDDLNKLKRDRESNERSARLKFIEEQKDALDRYSKVLLELEAEFQMEMKQTNKFKRNTLDRLSLLTGTPNIDKEKLKRKIPEEDDNDNNNNSVRNKKRDYNRE